MNLCSSPMQQNFNTVSIAQRVQASQSGQMKAGGRREAQEEREGARITGAVCLKGREHHMRMNKCRLIKN